MSSLCLWPTKLIRGVKLRFSSAALCFVAQQRPSIVNDDAYVTNKKGTT